jgi:hypothetical protein
MFLAALKADDDASIALLQSGMEHNPRAWQLPYDIGMVYLTNRRDLPDSPVLAAKWMHASEATGTAPAMARATAQGLMRQQGLTELERSLWEGILQSSADEFEKAIAHRKLEELAVRETVDALNEATKRYAGAHGRPPASLEELAAAGIMRQFPRQPDALGGRYFLDANGRVQNTALLDITVEQTLNRLRARIQDFQQREGRWPHDLEELVVHKYIRRIPVHPYPDRGWQYDNATGAIS